MTLLVPHGLYGEQQGYPVVDDCYIFVLRLSNPRKRQCTKQLPLQLNGTSQSQSKRQKLSHHSTGSQSPAAFWDNLSKVRLTEYALKELDRRNMNLKDMSDFEQNLSEISIPLPA